MPPCSRPSSPEERAAAAWIEWRKADKQRVYKTRRQTFVAGFLAALDLQATAESQFSSEANRPGSSDGGL
jgi:hypothetical protein